LAAASEQGVERRYFWQTGSSSTTGLIMDGTTSFADRPMITTQRLLLRRPDDGDTHAIVSIAGDWEVARRLSRVPHPYVSADASFFLEQVVPVEWIWAITLRGSKGLIGMVGLTPDMDDGSAELGYWLSPVDWGKGYATEAARAVVSYGFDTLGLRGLKSSFFTDNPASGRVLGKLGFVETGRRMQACLAAQTEALATEMWLSRPG
jgi:RimJ/RimL family protein N-acetyltransferase